ncbi:hypothetical protein AT246_03605 [Bartonella henselae]|uniref:Surface protein/adhesin n=2 Tax=Bartonella henselae TaxID=38323 RepID=X5M5P4_BARHN|nr:hypothetical protein [Bartonella henselae]ETS09167.1 hypothetical protein Q653_00854 [Bartonella henselae JK 42]ETS12492.1 hypothetical protein Q652_00984 [Bartonella henselae JK 41]KEC58176.1 hypothetical protein O97_00459 [Bartonella henselae str. Zeus]KEC61365.1 hypothetical protein O95_00004 [Bartonella henselae JK 53]MDM9987090.1 hypothetical protein [Bartonella henselae]
MSSIAALLSSISPIFSKNLDSREGVSTNIKSVAVVYSQNVISVYDASIGCLGTLDVQKDNYVAMLNMALAPEVNTLNDYTNFLIRTLFDVSGDNFVVNTLIADGCNRSKKAVCIK